MQFEQEILNFIRIKGRDLTDIVQNRKLSAVVLAVFTQATDQQVSRIEANREFSRTINTIKGYHKQGDMFEPGFASYLKKAEKEIKDFRAQPNKRPDGFPEYIYSFLLKTFKLYL